MAAYRLLLILRYIPLFAKERHVEYFNSIEFKFKGKHINADFLCC